MDIMKASADDLINHAITDDGELYNAMCDHFGEMSMLERRISDESARQFVSEFIIANPDF